LSDRIEIFKAIIGGMAANPEPDVHVGFKATYKDTQEYLNALIDTAILITDMSLARLKETEQ